MAVAVLAVTLIGVSLFYHNISPQAYYVPPFFGLWWFGGPFFGWFFFIPLIFLAFFALKWFIWRPWGWSGGYADDPAFEILTQRFARGEITREQFEQMSKDLVQSQRD